VRPKSDANISTRSKVNDGLHENGGITPAILNLDIVYAVRQQLHGQAAFSTLGNCSDMHWGGPIDALLLGSGSRGIIPAILNLNIVYAVRQQLHDQAAFSTLENCPDMHWGAGGSIAALLLGSGGKGLDLAGHRTAIPQTSSPLLNDAEFRMS
jgi:hypothetical protein